MRTRFFTALMVLAVALTACTQAPSDPQPESDASAPEALRIASLTPTATEFLFALGRGEEVVLRDATSVVPAEVNALPSAGTSHTFSLEGILAANPTHVVAANGKIDPALASGLQRAGVNVLMVDMPQSAEESKRLLTQLSSHFDRAAKGQQLMENYSCASTTIDQADATRVLFVYSHSGSGAMAAGTNTGVHAMIGLAGAQNVASEIEGFKPLSAEALVAYNPEVVLMFDHSFEAMGGADGILAIPGMDQTEAGRNRAFVHQPSHALNGFGLGFCADLQKLSEALKQTP